MSKRQTIGHHNMDLPASVARLHRGKTYRDLSTVMVVPTRGAVEPDVVSAWMGLIRPMNQQCVGPLFFQGYEVGDAYNQAVEVILAQLPTMKFMLTLETDNLPPPDGLVKLLETVHDGWDVVGGLYWTKGEGGQPMIYGDPAVLPRNFIPQVPQPGVVQRCHGLGMGFTLFKLDLLKKMAPDLPKDETGKRLWFRTRQEYVPGQGIQMFTQDLWFFDQAARYGAMVASDNRVLVGHLDISTGTVW